MVDFSFFDVSLDFDYARFAVFFFSIFANSQTNIYHQTTTNNNFKKERFSIILFFFCLFNVKENRGSLQDHCFRGNRQEVAKFLETKDGKDLKIDIDEPDTAGIRTPLHYACLGGRLNVVILVFIVFFFFSFFFFNFFFFYEYFFCSSCCCCCCFFWGG